LAPPPTPTRPAVVLILWFFSLILLLIAPAGVPLSRTQEARVLETARQMLTSPTPHPYLIPTLNGQPRLQKPPLAYWLTAASFHLFDISLTSARIPPILAGWLTLAITYLAGSHFFNRRTALLASVCLLSSYLFYRYTRLDETDTLATLFVTASCLCFWTASSPLNVEHPTSNKTQFLLYHAGAVSAALAALSKGPPAAFPFLFLLLLCITNRNYHPLKKLLTTASLLTFLLIASAWYAYLADHHLLSQITSEIDDLTTGRDHPASFLTYFPLLLTATAPWSAFFVASLVFAVQRFKSSPPLRALLCWLAAIFIPLCCVGNKQFHYLFPLLPPAFLLTAALLDHVLSIPQSDPSAKPIRILFLATLIGSILAGLSLPITSHLLIHHLSSTDFLIASLFLLASLLTLLSYRYQGFHRALILFPFAISIPMTLTLSLWLPPLVSNDFELFAADLHTHFGPSASYLYYSQFPKLPLNFYLRQSTPYLLTPPALRDYLSTSPDSLVLLAVKHDSPAPKPPPHLTSSLTLKGREQDLYVYSALP
jgi:4-amino-4-deoxy-L-arabinose transferase-like glycosyltransferase